MIKSKTELSLQELNEEIHMIVKGNSENVTSYFPNAEMVLEAFENYLQCCEIGGTNKKWKANSSAAFSVFQQTISSSTLVKYQQLLNLLLNWQFSFTSFLTKLFSTQIPPNTKQHYLPEINLTEIVFVMYLCLEVQRKQIIGKVQYNEQPRNMFLLKEIIKLLDEVYANGKCNKEYGYEQGRKDRDFSINQDKLVKILLLKALKIKLEKQNFSFALLGYESVQIQQQQKNQHIHKTKNISDVSFSLISIESQYNKSDLNQLIPETLKESLRMISSKLNSSHFELERRSLSTQEIFKYISLNESKGYMG